MSCSSFFASVEFLFYLFLLIFPDTPAFLSSALIVSAIGVLVSGLLLYGAHNVSSESNRMNYFYMIFIQHVLILR
jgi:hypothetical protein